MIARPFWLKRIEESWREAPIAWLCGVRRSGKTTLAEQLGPERGRHMADVAHRKLGVALGEGQKLVQRCWLELRRNSDSRGTGMSEPAHLASLSRCNHNNRCCAPNRHLG